VKLAVEYWSTILSDTGLKKKFRIMIEALLAGDDLDAARKGAALSQKDVASALIAVRDALVEEAPLPADIAAGLELTVFTDGASRGNPGVSACSAIFYDSSGGELLRRARKLGKTTNNVAEYEGLILALEIATELRAAKVVVKLDSELVVKQMNGEYKVKDPKLAELHQKVNHLSGHLPRVVFEHIPRTENKKADALVNAALDGKDLG
jgi:ribonuclease HI